jgi:DNA-binding MarR family transcriptional regulator
MCDNKKMTKGELMSAKNEEKLIELLRKENISGKRICETLNIQRNNLPRLITPLLEQNIIERNRDGQNYIYSLKLKKEERKSEDVAEAPLIPRKERPTPLKKKLLDIIKEKGKISRADCINVYHFFNKHLTRLAKQLENEGEIKYTKFRRNVYYSMTDIAPPKKEELKTSTQMAIEQIPPLKAFLHHLKIQHKSRKATTDTYSYNILT